MMDTDVSTMLQAWLDHRQAGAWLAAGGQALAIRATGAETAGAYSLVECAVPPGGGVPLHVHTREDEGFLVLSGAFEFVLGEARTHAPQGSFLMSPRGQPHRWRNPTGRPGRLLCMFSPSNIERLFQEAGRPVGGPDEPPPLTPQGHGRFLELASGYGLRPILDRSGDLQW